ncbi:MAG: 50S ribosomal protein L6 [Candidatus Bathyarchaeota archaeon]
MVQGIIEERSVEIPEQVATKLDGKVLTITGPLGELKKDFSHAPVQIEVLNKKIAVKTFWPRKVERSLVGTITTHIRNMVKGVTKGYTYKLNVVFSHFPITVKVQPKKVLIENFIGERSPRVAKIIGDCKVVVKGEEISVMGLDIEQVSQTAANIKTSTKIRRKDPRVFLDGIYVYEKGEGI